MMTNFLGVHLTLLIGPAVPVPAPLGLMEAFQSAQVTHTDEGRSGFQLVFQTGRSGPWDLLDYPLMTNPLLRPFNRVVLIVTFNAVPRVLMDGIITNQQLTPGADPGQATLTVTGEDVSLMMDLKQRQVSFPEEYPALPRFAIATMLILRYAQYGLIPMIIPSPTDAPPLPIQRVPAQGGKTDLGYIQELAGAFGYVFHVTPGPAPLANTAYWGPPIRTGIPQRALSVNMGPETNVENIGFQYNALAPTTVSGKVMDADLGVTLPVQTFASTRFPPLALQPALLVNQPNVRNTDLAPQNVTDPRLTANTERWANLLTKWADAMSYAQGVTDRSTDNVLTATGELNAMHYGEVLQPRGLVGLRGVGMSHDGMYYVKQVTHNVSKGEYKQRFTLTREGQGTLVPFVLP